MPRTIEIFIYDGRFELYRHNWSSNFDFAVSIKNLKNSKKKIIYWPETKNYWLLIILIQRKSIL